MSTKSNKPMPGPDYHHSELVQWHLHEIDPYNQEEKSVDIIAQELEFARADLLGILSASIKNIGRDRETKYRACHIMGFGVAISAVWPKQGISIDFGVYNYDFYMSWNITRFKHLFRVKDNFWHHLSSLSLLGNLKLIESDSPKPIFSYHTHSKVETHNSIVSNFIHSMIVYAIDDNASQDFGSLEISWPIDLPFEKLFSNISQASNHLHQMAYHLYRSEYQIEHAKNKRHQATRAT